MNVPYYNVVKFTTWLFLRLGFALQVRGRDNVPTSGAFIVASNHVSFLDPVVVGVACPRPLAFITRRSLYGHLLMRWFLHNMGSIPVSRGTADLSAIRAAIRQLRQGRPIAMFPEGIRQVSDNLSEAKRGVGLIASAARVPIVPAYITGTYDALPRGSARLRPSKIRVAFGPCIPYTDSRLSVGRLRKTEAAAHHEALADAVTQSWRRLRNSINNQ